MMLCRIEGSVHATAKDETLVGKTLLLAQPLDLELKPKGVPVVAVDLVSAGPGDLVILMREGGGARIVLDNQDIPVQALILAVVDDMQLGELR